MFRKKIYVYHRILSLIIAIPVLLWAVSGFMHPLMTNIKPAVATQKLPPVAIDSSAIRTPLPVALQRNNITTFHSVRLIHIDTNFFYQVQPEVTKAPVYISATNGKLLPSGDWLYAQYLARLFLEGQPASSPTATATPVAMMEEEGHDCCNAAAACVLNGTAGAKVANVSRITAFDKEYKYVNRLLPVHKVSFNRADGIRIYVETTQDRYAFAMDNKRAVFDNIFQWLHTWSWLDALGNTKLYFIIAICLLALITSALGIYIFCITKTKNAKGNGMLKARRNHRYTAIAGAAFTIAWTFSGGWHALEKFKTDGRDAFYISNQFPATTNFDLARLQQTVGKPVSNVSLVKMNEQIYWRVVAMANHTAHASHTPNGNMKTMEAPVPAVTFINATDYSILPNGEEKYAGWLATQFSKQPTAAIKPVTAITKFNDEYNFTDKRLPVFKVSYVNHADRYFVETSTGRLSLRVNDSDLREGYSFALLHKHHFMDWGGKAARDASTMIWVFFQIILIVIGLLLWWRKRAK